MQALLLPGDDLVAPWNVESWFPDQESNLRPLHCGAVSSPLDHQRSPCLILCCCCLVTKSCPTLQPHGLQHTRLPCPSPSPWVCSNSCPLSQWCHPTISSSVAFSSSCPQSFPASGLFQSVGSSHQVVKVFELQHQSFQWIFWVDFL